MEKKTQSYNYKSRINKDDTSWESIADDYHKLVHHKGHFYHETVILPNLLKHISVSSQDSLVDIGCGQGVLERFLPKKFTYLGLDASPKLLSIARKLSQSRDHRFKLHDMMQPLQIQHTFSQAAAILSLQNMQQPEKAIQTVADLLSSNGKFFIVINHPCFRIPKLSSWHYDESKKLMARRIDRYMSPIKIPILAHPGDHKNSTTTLSFHFPLSYWFKALNDSGFCVNFVEEWVSNKTSVGKRAKAENLCRKEFPLFLFIACTKK